MISSADIEAELNRPDRGRHTAFQNIILLLLSLGLFVATGGISATWTSVVIVVTVLFIHEFGHWLGMRFFGYSNLKMFFIPFFGAAVAGKESNISAERRAIVSLLGPTPGIILGIISGLIYMNWREPIFLQFGFIFIVINGFNLLPIYPLDGGRFMEIVVFSRHPVVEIIFKALAVLVLLGIAVRLHSVPLGILAAFTLLATREAFFQNKIIHRLKEMHQDAPLTEKIPIKQLEAILPELSIGFSEKGIKVKILANRAESVWRKFLRQPPKFRPSLILLGIYALIIIFGVLGILELISLKKM